MSLQPPGGLLGEQDVAPTPPWASAIRFLPLLEFTSATPSPGHTLKLPVTRPACDNLPHSHTPLLPFSLFSQDSPKPRVASATPSLPPAPPECQVPVLLLRIASGGALLLEAALLLRHTKLAPPKRSLQALVTRTSAQSPTAMTETPPSCSAHAERPVGLTLCLSPIAPPCLFLCAWALWWLTSSLPILSPSCAFFYSPG